PALGIPHAWRIPFSFSSWCARLAAPFAPFACQPLSHRNKVVARKELGREHAPGAAFDLDIDDIEQMRRQPQGDDLPDSHHHVPAHDLHSLRWKTLPPTRRGKVRLNALQVFRLIVPQKDGHKNGVAPTATPPTPPGVI